MLLFQANSLIYRNIINQQVKKGFCLTKSTDAAELKVEDTQLADELVDNEETRLLEEEEFNKKRNISKLLPSHRNMLYNELPYKQSESWIHTTAKYKRMMFGRYGTASGVDPSICFQSKKEIEEQNEYMKVAFPLSLPQMMELNKKNKLEKNNVIKAREEIIEKKLAKLEQWKHELQSKVAKKEMDARQAKERKERLVEEVKRHFGYKVDPRDERFKEMLEIKEKEDKKKNKEEKRKAKEAKLMEKLLTKKSE